MDEEALFEAALGLPPGADRRAFLDEACAGDPALRARVARLLDADDRTAGMLDAGRTAAFLWATTDPGLGRRDVIAGRYELIEPIGEGGMGRVWLADQAEPVRRRVALKLIRPGMDSQAVLARFEAERQALALMDHPNIARVFDGGATADGRPFFVMEYVAGVPLTEYCDVARLDVAERLDLFVAVCRAVQHAHTKGVIHRDLKPGNILVATVDGRPVPKVIDFGLAKATAGLLAESPAVTAIGSTLGTPLYMSPEQADPGNPDIDARADVYSLGVILYELLTGTTPLERRRFRELAWAEILRLIREEDPPRPSARLGVSDSLPSLAALRHLEPARLTRMVRGDLDWIVMKCLEKDRARRYETPSGLAQDLRRYLEDESIEARPPSARYRLGKFLRRNRGSAIAAAAMAVLLIGGIVGTSWGLFRANRARDAEAARADGERLANARAQRRLEQLEQGNELLASVFDDLDPQEETKGGKPLRAILGERLARAAERLEGEAVGDPLTVAALQDRLGRSLVNLGHADRAVPVLEASWNTRVARLGGDHPETLESLNNLAGAHSTAGRMDLALPILKRTFALRKARLGPNHVSTLESLNNLAIGYQSSGRTDLALPLHEEMLRLTTAVLGPEHVNTLTAKNNLAVAYQEAGEPQRAVPLLEDFLARMTADLGPTHRDTLAAMNNLAAALRVTGNPDRALTLHEEAVRLLRAGLGEDHPDTLAAKSNLAAAYRASGQLQKSLSLLRAAAASVEARQFEIQNGGLIVKNLIGTLELSALYDEAGTWRRKWMAVVKAEAGADSIPYADELKRLAINLMRQEDWTAAEGVLRECLAIRDAKEPDALETHDAQSLLGRSLMGQEKYAEAESWIVRGYEGIRSHVGRSPSPDPRLVAEAGQRIVRLYELWGRPGKVAEWRARLSRPGP